MAKPPKKIPGSPTPEVSTTTRSTPDPLTGTRTHIVHPLPGADPIPTSPSADALPGASVQRPSVIVSLMPDPHNPSTPRHGVTASQTQDTATTSLASIADTSLGSRPPHPVFIDPESASQLNQVPGTSEGIRYDKHKKAYVEMAGGTVMVRKGADGYRLTHAQESSPTGDWVEQIPGSQLWRQIAPAETTSKRPHPEPDLASSEVPQATAGPSKRARLSDESNVATDAGAWVESLFSRQANALDLSSGQWKNWGRATRPESGESIEIDGKHYLIVPNGLRRETGLVYLQHPGFTPGHFDAFEHMLRHEPSRQPKWALKREDQWKVLDDHPPFAMSTTQYVSTAFNSLSDQSVNAVARAVFERASLPDGMNANGLSVMAMTFRHWTDRVNSEMSMHSLSDPLLMLPRLPTQPDNLVSGGILTLPARNLDLLQRLDFDPQRFVSQWDTYIAAPTPASLRNLFSRVLQRSGYRINTARRRHIEGALIFHRPSVAAIFVLKLPRITGNTVLRNTLPGAELTNIEFQAQLSAADRQKLNNELAQAEVIYLVGGVQQSPDNPTLFMVREG